MKRLFLIILIFLSALFIYQYYPYSPIPDNIVVDKIIVNKSERKLIVYSNGSIIKTFTVSLGDQPIGAKEKKDDEKTPEGKYIINSKMGKGVSRFHKNLGISYPSKKDIAYAKQNGFSTGGDIKIHGIKNGLGFIGRLHRWLDWTDGCIAITNEEMDDLYKHVKINTPIFINP